MAPEEVLSAYSVSVTTNRFSRERIFFFFSSVGSRVYVYTIKNVKLSFEKRVFHVAHPLVAGGGEIVEILFFAVSRERERERERDTPRPIVT